MKYFIYAILILLFFAGFSFPEKKERKILFVGAIYNSDMLQILQKMFEEQRLHIKVEQLTPADLDLALHAVSVWHSVTGNVLEATPAEKDEIPTTIKKILSEKWDMVILKEATINTMIPDVVTFFSQPAVQILDSSIKKINGKTVVFESYAYNHYPEQYYCPKYLLSYDSKRYPVPIMKTKDTYCTDSFRNSKEEFHVIQSSCDQMAKKVKAGIARAGYAYELCKKQYPEIPLYDSKDNDHPSKQGSYLIACVFYKYITKTKVGNVKYCAGIDENQARKIRKLVDAGL